jgi:hypothetical protein
MTPAQIDLLTRARTKIPVARFNRNRILDRSVRQTARAAGVSAYTAMRMRRGRKPWEATV